MRVCILARPCPGSWVDHYIAAFRRHYDTLVVGPRPDAAALTDWGRAGQEDSCQKVDVACDFTRPFDLPALFPSGWQPDLVVGISGLGGAPLYQRVAALTCPTAYITVDTWQCLYDYGEARGYDFVFAAQREFIPRLRATGSHRVHWLPLACAPEAHYPVACAPTHDIAFAGSTARPVYRTRRALLDALSGHFSLLERGGVFGEELATTFARGRIAFNHCAVREVNMRIFEVLGMGRPLLTNAESAANGLLDLFGEGVHLTVYDSESDLLRRARDLLANAPLREQLAREGRARVLAEHTYDHRVESLLRAVEAQRPAAAAERAARAYRGPRLHDYLPWAPGVVLDYGLGLKASRIALHRRGVRELVGLSLDGDTARRASYDTFITEGECTGPRVDTVVIEARGKSDACLERALPHAHALLIPGGNLVLGLDAGTRSRIGTDMGTWLLQHGFHMRLESLPLDDGGGILAARKRTRPLRNLVETLSTELRIPEMDIPALCARIPRNW